MVNGYSENNGIVEICIDGIWMGACASNYRPIIATAVCKQLGYTRIHTIHFVSFKDKLILYTGGARLDTAFFLMNEEALAYVSLRYYYCSRQTYSPISCVYGSSNTGVYFYELCSSTNVLSVLCCGNGTHCHGQHVVTLS